MYMYVCMYVCMCVSMYVIMYVCMYGRVCVCVRMSRGGGRVGAKGHVSLLLIISPPPHCLILVGRGSD